MGRVNFKKREVRRAVEEKLGIQLRSNAELNGWYYLEGQKVLRVTVPKGVSDLPPGTAHQIRKQLWLGTPDFIALVRCPMSGNDYEALIRTKLQLLG